MRDWEYTRETLKRSADKLTEAIAKDEENASEETHNGVLITGMILYLQLGDFAKSEAEARGVEQK